jgi:subtilisin-like proprotein convertase family protein
MGILRKRKNRGLAVLALLVLGLVSWQVSSWTDRSVGAAAPRAAIAALDAAAATYQADPTDANARKLNAARIVFEKAAAKDPTLKIAKPGAPIALSALVQIKALNSMKRALTRTQRKIGSRLMVVARKKQGKLPVVLETMRTSVETSKRGDAVVDLTVTSVAAGMKALDPYNFNITSAVGHTIRAEIPFNKLEEVAALPAIIAIREAAHARTLQTPTNLNSRVDTVAGAPRTKQRRAERAKQVSGQLQAAISKIASDNKTQAKSSAGSAVSPRSLTVVNTSEGDKTHRALDARNAFLVNGTGVKIGVISDGVDSLATSQGTGDLGSVTVLTGQAGAGDEGTAMLEIVHDLAPGAQLFFATADPDQAQFAQNIRDLRTAGCDIIVDDIIYLDESPLHDGQPAVGPGSTSTMGLIEQAVNDVTAAGALYFSSAGNEGNKDDNTSGTWEGDFNPNGTPEVLDGSGPCHNFGDGGQSVSVPFGDGSNTPPILHWSDPLTTSANDYDLYDLDDGLTQIFDASFDTQDGVGGDDEPFEGIFGGTFSGERLAVALFDGSTRFISLEIFRGTLAINTTGSSHGHSQAAAAFSTAAAPAAAAFGPGEPSGPFPNPFTASQLSETFTSDGPRQLFYQANGTLFGAGVLAGQGLIRQKPDITAADGVSTSVAGFETFYGTSAAAPHAAAIAALVKSGVPAITPAQMRTALTSSAIDIETAGTDRDTGAGIVMAFQALQAAGATGVATLGLGTTSFTETGGDSDGFPEPCERLSLTLPINNNGAATATAISAALTSSTAGVVITPASSTYPDIPVSGSANNDTPFSVVLPCSLACGSTVDFTLTVTYTGGTSPQAFNFSYFLGGPGTPVTVSYTGPAVPIPDATDLSGDNPGAPVVAPLLVSGISGKIFDLNFRIDGTSCSTAAGSTTVGIDHTFVSDLKLSLISPIPGPTTVAVIDKAGGGGNSGNNFCQTLLDDQTANPSIETVVSGNAPYTGTFKPNAALSAFRGLDPNGTWNFQAQDFFSGDTGNIRAYSLIITPTDCTTTACGVTCPANITVPATGPTGAIVNYPEATVTGGCGVLNYSTASGSLFPVGTTPVTVTGAGGATCNFNVTVNPPVAAPANDDCANAIVVTPANCNFSDTQDTTGSTDQVGEPASTCTDQSNSVWYKYTNTTADQVAVTVSTCTSDFDTAVMVWKQTGASCDFANFVAVSCNDDACGDGFQSLTSFVADPGQTYMIQSGGFDGETGSLTTKISCEVFTCPSTTIHGTLGSGSPDHAFTTGNQTGRLNRNGISSSCSTPKSCNIFTATGSRAYDAYTFPNTSGADACVLTHLDVTTASGANYQVNAYLDSYDPANICTNYLADPGLSSGGGPQMPTDMSFTVPNGHSVVLVVQTTNPGETGGLYTLNVLGNLCIACTLTCPADITKQPDPNQNGAIVNYPAPTTTGSCGTVTCTPASGSFFPIGTTPVSCTSTAGPSCNFNVNVKAPRYWTSAGSTGTIDEDSVSKLTTDNFTTRLTDGTTGTGTIRYNITAVEGISSYCPATQSVVNVRFRNSDNTGAHAQVKFEIHRTNIVSGGNDIIFNFNSNGLGAGGSFTSASIAPNIDFDFSNYIYWIEATIFRDNAAQFADLGSIQISESAGTPCP